MAPEIRIVDETQDKIGFDEENVRLQKKSESKGWHLGVLLEENNKEYVAHVYPEVNHGFHNNTTPRYDESAASLAWSRTVAFFNSKLK